MIHAYEWMLKPYLALREWLLLDLHGRLKRRIGERRLRRLVDMNVHSLIVPKSPGHGLLFALKSFELDMRLEWELGTVFGYERADMLV